MKLKELLDIIFIDGPITSEDGKISDYCLMGKNLEKYKEKLLKCDEFKSCMDLEIVPLPSFEDSLGRCQSVMSYKLGENHEFMGKAYIYSILLSPEIYDVPKILGETKNGAVVIPTTYDPMTFTPKKQIIITFDPEELTDDRVLKINNKAEELKKLFNDALENPDKYKPKGERKILIRGIFERKNKEQL